jgi:hypothetical protein
LSRKSVQSLLWVIAVMACCVKSNAPLELRRCGEA